MNSSTLSSRAIKRVLRDLAEAQKDPIPGIAICMPDINDPFTLHGNILVKDGIYEGVLIHIVVHIPEEFPIKPPAVNIAPGLDFGIKYHSHIYDNLIYGNSICTDLTSNFAGHFSVIDAHGKPTRSGWTPAYTLSSVLMQLQVFFADPDMPKEALPLKEDIQKLKDHISQYRLDIRTCNGEENSVEIITHSYENPYPALSSEISEPVVSEDKEIVEEEEKPAKTGFVKKEVSIGSNSTANSEIEKQSGGQNISIVNSPSSEKKQELLEELKEGEIEQVKEVLANGKEVVCDWDKPLKKVSKEGSNKTQKQKNTVVVKVVKKAPVKQTNKVDLLAEFNKQRKKYDRVTNNRKISYQHTIQLYASQASATQANQKALVPSGYQNVNTNEVQIEADSFSTKSDIYKESVTENKATFKQRNQELSNKLICSVSKVNVFDNSKPILGYPIDLEKDAYGRLWPTPIMEILSYDSFVFNIQQHFEKLDNYHRVKFTSSFGSQYNYWLPVYINNEHFERSKQYIFNAIAIIYGGVEGKKENDFHPLMVLKVLPPILVKTAIHFLKGTIHQSIVGIDAYCQLYRLFVKLVDMFPEIKEAIDTEVQNFCKSDTNRHKKVAGDLGEFIIKLSLSSKGIQDPHLINMVFREHITRQVSWSLKKDRGLGLKEQCSNFVERFMIASQVANQFFLTKMEIARLLLDEDVKADLEKRCGILNENTMQLFRGRLSWIQKNVVQDWRVLVKALQQEAYIHDDQKMESYVGKAFDRAKAKGYLENTY